MPAPRRSTTAAGRSCDAAGMAERCVELGEGRGERRAIRQRGGTGDRGGRGRRGRRRTSRGSSAPFQRLISRLNGRVEPVLVPVGQPRRARTPPRSRGPRRRSTVKRTCLPSPIVRTSVMRAAGTSRTGRGLPIPNGASRPSSSARRCPCPRRRRPRRPAARARGRPGPGRRRRARRTRRAAPRRSLAATVQPAAARWPPWRSRCAAHASSPASRSNAGIERPEPVPWSPSSAISSDRPVVALGEPRGDDADHARVPVRAGEHVGRLLAGRGDLRLGLEDDPRLDVAALRVGLVELRGDRVRARADRRSAAARPRRRRGACGRRR